MVWFSWLAIIISVEPGVMCILTCHVTLTYLDLFVPTVTLKGKVTARESTL